MQISEQRIAEVLDFARFESTKSMEKIVSAFAEKYKLNSREKVSFEELSGEKTAKTKQQNHENPSRSVEKKNGRNL